MKTLLAFLSGAVSVELARRASSTSLPSLHSLLRNVNGPALLVLISLFVVLAIALGRIAAQEARASDVHHFKAVLSAREQLARRGSF